jgi:hypothetical protein
MATRKLASQESFLAAFEASGCVRLAARAAGITRKTHYHWLQHNPAYAVRFQKSQMIAADLLQDEAVRRAVEGWTEPIFYKGEQCGAVWRYDGALLQFLLRGLLPEKYGRKPLEAGKTDAAPGQAEIKVKFVRPGDVVKPEAAAGAPPAVPPAGQARSRIDALPPAPLPSKSLQRGNESSAPEAQDAADADLLRRVRAAIGAE